MDLWKRGDGEDEGGEEGGQTVLGMLYMREE